MAPTTEDHGPMMTFETVLEWKAEGGKIVPPFSEDEVALALSVARAYFYAHTFLEELPEHAGLTTIDALSWCWGIHMVMERRGGRTYR